jgi:hypothetical protein
MAQEELLRNKIIKILLAKSINFLKIKNQLIFNKKLLIAYLACIQGLKDGTNSDVQVGF